MAKPLLFIDTEFCNYSKMLISMAIVDGYSYFYEVLDSALHPRLDQWVKDNVITVLHKEPIIYPDFQKKLEKFLSKYSRGFIIVADWPDDIKWFCESLITGPGKMINIPSFDMMVKRDIDSSLSKIPHNALEDAAAIRDSYQKKYVFPENFQINARQFKGSEND